MSGWLISADFSIHENEDSSIFPLSDFKIDGGHVCSSLRMEDASLRMEDSSLRMEDSSLVHGDWVDCIFGLGCWELNLGNSKDCFSSGTLIV